MNKAAQALGRMSAGKPKRFSVAEIARRTARIQKYNAERKKVAAVGAKRSESGNAKLCNSSEAARAQGEKWTDSK